MEIHKAIYLQSVPDLSKCPTPDKPEMAFIGRSNVGKSSLINFLVGQKGLAQTSSKPGKTKSINHFLVNDQWYLVDLPGYGYAHISQAQRLKWLNMTRDYLKKRENLVNVFLLIDGSIPPQKKDIEFANWMGQSSVPFSIVFTKTDKAKAIEVKHHLNSFNKILLESWEELPNEFSTSVEKKLGKEAILSYIEYCISTFKKPD